MKYEALRLRGFVLVFISPLEFITQKSLMSLEEKNVQIKPPAHEILTQRETEVLKSLAEGNSYQEIANILFISHETVKQHLKNIYRKLGVKNKIQAINKTKS